MDYILEQQLKDTKEELESVKGTSIIISIALAFSLAGNMVLVDSMMKHKCQEAKSDIQLSKCTGLFPIWFQAITISLLYSIAATA